MRKEKREREDLHLDLLQRQQHPNAKSDASGPKRHRVRERNRGAVLGEVLGTTEESRQGRSQCDENDFFDFWNGWEKKCVRPAALLVELPFERARTLG